MTMVERKLSNFGRWKANGRTEADFTKTAKQKLKVCRWEMQGGYFILRIPSLPPKAEEHGGTAWLLNNQGIYRAKTGCRVGHPKPVQQSQPFTPDIEKVYSLGSLNQKKAGHEDSRRLEQLLRCNSICHHPCFIKDWKICFWGNELAHEKQPRSLKTAGSLTIKLLKPQLTNYDGAA